MPIGRFDVSATARILIADDEPNIRRLLRVLLERVGYTVAEVKDGGEAWRKLQAEPFDLLITDLMMPELDGFQLLKLINSLDRTATMPVIVMYAYPNDAPHPPSSLFQPAHDRGKSEPLNKPFNPTSELIPAVKRMLGEAA